MPHPKARFPTPSCKITRKDDDIPPRSPASCLHLNARQEPSMKKTVLTFGLIAGVVISVLMDGSVLLAGKIGSGHSLILGYTNMVASFLLIYFGIRSYRDNTLA